MLMAIAMKSLQPSPMPLLSRVLRQAALAGPPVRRLERPCVYSWQTMSASKEESRRGIAVLGVPQRYIRMRPEFPSWSVSAL